MTDNYVIRVGIPAGIRISSGVLDSGTYVCTGSFVQLDADTFYMFWGEVRDAHLLVRVCALWGPQRMDDALNPYEIIVQIRVKGE